MNGSPWTFFAASEGQRDDFNRAAAALPRVLLAWLLVWGIARLGAGGAAAAIDRLAGR